MLPVTTEYLLADPPSRDFARTLGYLAVGVLVGCAVAMIIGFLVVTASHRPWEGPGDEQVSRDIEDLFHYDGGSLQKYGEIVQAADVQADRHVPHSLVRVVSAGAHASTTASKTASKPAP